jgi:hypothetical protein
LSTATQQDRKMSHHLERVAAMLARSGGGGVEKLKRRLMFSVLAIALTGCGFATSRDVRAYNACMNRHPQEVPVCEGPRQAYELDPTGFQARAIAIGPPTGSSYEELLPAAHPPLTPVPLHPSPIASGRNG